MFPRPLLSFKPVFVSLKCVEFFLHVHWPAVLLLSDYQVELAKPIKTNPFKKYLTKDGHNTIQKTNLSVFCARIRHVIKCFGVCRHHFFALLFIHIHLMCHAMQL